MCSNCVQYFVILICFTADCRDAVVWFDYNVGKHSGPGEVFIIPDMGDTKNQTQCKCHDRSVTMVSRHTRVVIY